MKTYKTTHKCVEHVESAVLHVLAWCIIALFMKTIYNVDREIPKSQINPRHDHSGIEESLNKEWGDINSVPPQPNCLENKPTFECHPQLNSVIDKIKEIL